MINTSFRLAPWADLLYACDIDWWRQYAPELARGFTGERWTSSMRAMSEFGLSFVASRTRARLSAGECISRGSRGINSGFHALGLAALFGASRVILLGYDYQKTGGRSHWHGDHPEGLGNLGRLDRWVEDMAELSADLAAAGIQVLNATQQTALRCFPKLGLESALS